MKLLSSTHVPLVHDALLASVVGADVIIAQFCLRYAEGLGTASFGADRAKVDHVIAAVRGLHCMTFPSRRAAREQHAARLQSSALMAPPPNG